jgi:hypothetical protein
MVRIELHERALGPEQPLRLLNSDFAKFINRDEAIRYIKVHIKQRKHRGHNEEQDAWWCWNDGDTVEKVLIIR